MCNNLQINEILLKPLEKINKIPKNSAEIEDLIISESFIGTDVKTYESYDEILSSLFSGFCLLFIDKCTKIFAFGLQGFEKRSVEQAFTEVQERGSMECFVENVTDNIALLRRKLKTPDLKTEIIKIGKTSQTSVIMCYLSDRIDEKYVKEVKNRLKNAILDSVLTSEYLKPFLDTNRLSFFSAVGTTERPDVLSSKLTEGRISVLVDGSPFALYIPFLAVESFHNLDDYSYRPYYAFFIRLLRAFCFIISIMLPGFYVAVCVHHQEVLSQAMLVEIAIQENITPFSITVEALFVHLVYEIVREAGLRMPKAVGHAVSIVGALVIGEAAVTAGIIAAPMVIIVAFTAVGSFVVSNQYEAISVLRLLMIIIAGISGFFGLMLAFGIIIINCCSINPYSVPFSSGITPFNISVFFRDLFYRMGWKNLGKRQLLINKLEK